MKMFLLGLMLSMLNCCQGVPSNTVILRGNLKNLPDGKIFLIDEQNTKLDSTHTNNGVFQLKISQYENSKKYKYVTLEHFTKDGVKRLFQFKTNRKYKNGPWLSEYFILENGIQISGNLEEFIPKDFKLSAKIKLVYPAEPIKTGKQTWAMYNISYDFSQYANEAMINELGTLIKKYPDSYYLLHEISKYQTNFSVLQLQKFLSLFNKNLLNYDEAKTIQRGNKVRATSPALSNIFTTEFVTSDNNVTTINKDKAELNMIILWASWCQPCIAEIPEIKYIHKKYINDKRLNIVSVSMDDNKDDWIAALSKYKMTWLQLFLSNNIKRHSRELFQFDGSIPTVLFIDSNGMVIKKITGYDKENVNVYLKTISTFL